MINTTIEDSIPVEVIDHLKKNGYDDDDEMKDEDDSDPIELEEGFAFEKNKRLGRSHSTPRMLMRSEDSWRVPPRPLLSCTATSSDSSLIDSPLPRAIFRMRIVLFAVIALVGVIFTIGTYLVAHQWNHHDQQQQQQVLVLQLQQRQEQIRVIIQVNLERVLTETENLASDILWTTSQQELYAGQSHFPSTWPLVTLSATEYWDEHVPQAVFRRPRHPQEVSNRANVVAAFLLPWVPSSFASSWENFTNQQHQRLLLETQSVDYKKESRTKKLPQRDLQQRHRKAKRQPFDVQQWGVDKNSSSLFSTSVSALSMTSKTSPAISPAPSIIPTMPPSAEVPPSILKKSSARTELSGPNLSISGIDNTTTTTTINGYFPLWEAYPSSLLNYTTLDKMNLLRPGTLFGSALQTFLSPSSSSNSTKSLPSWQPVITPVFDFSSASHDDSGLSQDWVRSWIQKQPLAPSLLGSWSQQPVLGCVVPLLLNANTGNDVDDSYLNDTTTLVGAVSSLFPLESLLIPTAQFATGDPIHVKVVAVDRHQRLLELWQYNFLLESDQISFLGGDEPAHVDLLKDEGGWFLSDWLLSNGVEYPYDEDYFIRVYDPNSETTAEQGGAYPGVFTFLVALLFCLMGVVFAIYDRLMIKQHGILRSKASQSNALVSNLFPERIRNRLLENVADLTRRDENDEDGTVTMNGEQRNSSQRDETESSGMVFREHPKLRLRNFLRETNNAFSSLRRGDPQNHPQSQEMDTKPIADFFPNCTVLFGDIVGFTAWSSEREPSQVFMLLQDVYQAFDQAARRRGVFKVETIGDSYVAVTGLPDPQDDHAVIMAGFALECRKLIREVTQKLERVLGPETGDLCMRFGLHSGPVTAGVLRGERSRFQLFGDTVNTAARMESTGTPNCIQVSEYTATLLSEAGKDKWLTPRDNVVSVKGKGEMQTFWLESSKEMNRRMSMESCYTMGSFANRSSKSLIDYLSEDGDDEKCPRQMLKPQKSVIWGGTEEVLPRKSSGYRDVTARLVDWNVDVLTGLLKQVVAARRSRELGDSHRSGLLAAFSPSMSECNRYDFSNENASAATPREGITSEISILEEVTEIVELPQFDPLAANEHIDPLTVNLDEDVELELQDYVKTIASMYRDNPFHNFEHACHVQMSILKLLQRVVVPEEIEYTGESAAEVASSAHTYTYGIASDPLTQFTVVFCALIHDVDHAGVSNGQLIKEKAHVATAYNNKCVAEQNSIDLAWELLMQPKFENLRACIYTNMSEFKRFRQLVANIVLATDIFDPELSALRKNRWKKAFSAETPEEECPGHAANRKATIVLEHLIQASDVSHTMQHWEVYRKWNELLFHEMNLAFTSGRCDFDPSKAWYTGELRFFDNYIIPLAKKLKECGVFGVSSDECLNYALENRRLWEIKGQTIVEEMRAVDYSAKGKEERQSRRSGQRPRRKLDLSDSAD